MSSTMVAANGGPSFAQQGSVDWVALSNSSVQFSVAVLARLSRAGIDAFTLQFGRAICSSFSLEPHARERIYDVIVKLKSMDLTKISSGSVLASRMSLQISQIPKKASLWLPYVQR